MLDYRICDIPVFYTTLGILGVTGVLWFLAYKHGIKSCETSRDSEFDRRIQSYYEDEREDRRDAALRDKKP